jgi:hypothetical protein
LNVIDAVLTSCGVCSVIIFYLKRLVFPSSADGDSHDDIERDCRRHLPGAPGARRRRRLNTAKNAIIGATAFALVMGPVASFAGTCGGGTEAALATQMTHIMVCDPQGASVGHFDAHEWRSGGLTGGTIDEFSDPARPTAAIRWARTPMAERSLTPMADRATPSYVVAVSGSTMFYCLDSNGSLQYTASFKPAASPAACP